MANLKEIRSRISSVSSTMQITSAMKLVSAAKLKRAQDAIIQMRPYAEKLQEILVNLSSSLDVSENIYATERPKEKVLIIGITSNRGLCGGFNNAVIKRINHLVKEDYKDKSVEVLPLGKRLKDAHKETGLLYQGDFLPEGVEDVFADLSFDTVGKVAEHIMEQFTKEQFDEVVIIYNKFKNAATQILMNEPYLPIQQPEGQDNQSSRDYIFEPNKEDIVKDLIPRSLKVQLYKALLDSHAAEHGARMTAMHKATDNASELKRDLKLKYNKARQAAITNEILEIVAGAEALNG